MADLQCPALQDVTCGSKLVATFLNNDTAAEERARLILDTDVLTLQISTCEPPSLTSIESTIALFDESETTKLATAKGISCTILTLINLNAGSYICTFTPSDGVERILDIHVICTTAAPTEETQTPTFSPTAVTLAPSTTSPSPSPTSDPTTEPTSAPTPATGAPTHDPTPDPTSEPTYEPTVEPTDQPTGDPTEFPSFDPSSDPTRDPTPEPTVEPTGEPTGEPTTEPTNSPSFLLGNHSY